MPVGGVCECALKLPRVWEGCVAIILHITGCQPDSGKPTVRDERGAYGNVGYGGIRHPLAIERARAGHSPPKAVRAVFLPDARAARRCGGPAGPDTPMGWSSTALRPAEPSQAGMAAGRLSHRADPDAGGPTAGPLAPP